MKIGNCWRPRKFWPNQGTQTVKQKPDFVFKITAQVVEAKSGRWKRVLNKWPCLKACSWNRKSKPWVKIYIYDIIQGVKPVTVNRWSIMLQYIKSIML